MKALKIAAMSLAALMMMACSQQNRTADPGLSGEELNDYLSSFFSDPGSLSTNAVDDIQGFFDSEFGEIYFAEGCKTELGCPMGSPYSIMALNDMSFLQGNGSPLDAFLIQDARVTFLYEVFEEGDAIAGLLLDFDYSSTNEVSNIDEVIEQYYVSVPGTMEITTDPITQSKKFEVVMTPDNGGLQDITVVTYDVDANDEFKPVITLELYDSEGFYLGKLSSLSGFF